MKPSPDAAMKPDPSYAELFKLPLAERLQLVEDLWDSIAAERELEPVAPEVVAELHERAARYDADPSRGIGWEDAKRRLRGEG